VYRISDDSALVSTVDFITPPVDDPYWFGQIAAANSLSDVYAMGGKPLVALNVVMFPSKRLDISFLQEILRGGSEKVTEADAVMAGGHTVDDNEPKYGLSVTGVVHPQQVLTNCGAYDGDALILTKPLGTGVLFNACRSKKLPLSELEPLLSTIALLNKTALERALTYHVHACTDVTGFGIVGHALEIALGSCAQIDIFYNHLPFYPNSLVMYKKGETTGSNEANRDLSKKYLTIQTHLKNEEKELLFDPQTSGGLLFCVPSSEAEKLVTDLKDNNISDASYIGQIRKNHQEGPRVRIC
jgi:selenide,water dikinase